MKIVGVLLVCLLVTACSDAMIEEIAFRKTLEYDLVELCGEEDTACIAAVETQVKDCMEQSSWRQYLEDQDNEAELNRFTTEFYACIVDEDGNPYFEIEG